MHKAIVLYLAAFLFYLLPISASAQGQGDESDTLVKPEAQSAPVETPKADNLTADNGRPSPFDKLKISGWGGIEFGQIMHGLYGPEPLDHRWQECFRSRLDITAPVSSRLLVNFAAEIWYQYSTTVAQTNGPSYLPGINVILDEANLAYTLFDGAFPLSVQAGYFEFKYNAEATNLGEYLFRSGCYPTFVTNVFDYPMTHLLGLNIENSLLKDNKVISFHQSLLLTSETELYPYEDISLSYLPSATVWNGFVTLGGGICGQRLFSVDGNNTTPHSPKTISEIRNIRPVLDSNNVPIPGDTTGDTTFFSFAGTKVMGHLTIDPKALFTAGISGIFGKEDLKIYGEVAVLGLKNYPMYKDSTIRFDLLSERMPMMVGFNFPTFKFLDVLSLEFEYFKNRYYNSYYQEIVGEGVRLPRPYSQDVGDRHGVDSLGYHHNVKWSVYAKKSIGKNVQIIAQVAKDHRHAFINLSDPRYGDFGDNLSTPKDWYYYIKLAYGF